MGGWVGVGWVGWVVCYTSPCKTHHPSSRPIQLPIAQPQPQPQTPTPNPPPPNQIIELSGAHELLSPLEELVLLVAALCHDLDHDGRSNSYHINAHTELAQRYNDRSGAV